MCRPQKTGAGGARARGCCCVCGTAYKAAKHEQRLALSGPSVRKTGQPASQRATNTAHGSQRTTHTITHNSLHLASCRRLVGLWCVMGAKINLTGISSLCARRRPMVFFLHRRGVAVSFVRRRRCVVLWRSCCCCCCYCTPSARPANNAAEPQRWRSGGGESCGECIVLFLFYMIIAVAVFCVCALRWPRGLPFCRRLRINALTRDAKTSGGGAQCGPRAQSA